MKTNEERIEDLEKHLADLEYLVLKQTKSTNTIGEIIELNIKSINLLSSTLQIISEKIRNIK